LIFECLLEDSPTNSQSDNKPNEGYSTARNSDKVNQDTWKATFDRTTEGRYRMTIDIDFSHSPHDVITETTNKKKDEIDVLIAHLGALYMFALFIPTFGVVRSKIHGSSEYWSTFMTYNEVLTPTIRICGTEFQGLVSELSTGAYNGAARTLRYVLETAIQACVFQTESKRSTYATLLTDYRSALDPSGQPASLELFMKNNSWLSFIERYNVYEQTNRIAPTFAELVNILNSRELFQEAPDLSSEIKKVYKTLSDYVHLNASKIESQLKRKKISPPIFDPNQFDIIFELALRVVDAIDFAYVKSISHFFGYNNCEEFLQELSMHLEIAPQYRDQFLNLPFCSKLSRSIQWKTLNLPSKNP